MLTLLFNIKLTLLIPLTFFNSCTASKKRLNRTTKTFYVIYKTIIDIKRHNKYFSPIIVTLGYRNEGEGKRRAVCITTVNKSSKRRAKKFPLKRPESHFGMPNDNNKQLIFVQHHKTIPTQALLRFVRLSWQIEGNCEFTVRHNKLIFNKHLIC